MERKLPRLLIGGTHSGCGKTTVTSAILQALVNRGASPAAFKCGPDYLDPMFHSEIIGAPSRNLDLFLCAEDTVRALLAKNTADASVAVLEGVMGYYDGVGGATLAASSCDLALKTNTPSVLVLSVKGMSLSAAATLSGFLRFRKNTIAGVILNGVTRSMFAYYRDIIETETSVHVYGHLPTDAGAALGSRHLGLITAAEISDLQQRLQRLAALAEDCIDLEGLLALAESAPPLRCSPAQTLSASAPPVRIAVARDRAFCFYYEDSLDLLRELGAELVPFSPLADAALPQNISGLYLGGGYPELHAEALSRNTQMLTALRRAVAGGLPTVAECGGFMLLHERIVDGEGRAYPAAGVIRGAARLQTRLQNFGYVTLTAERDTLLCKKGDTIRAHEFHYCASDDAGDACTARKPVSGKAWRCVHGSDTLFAGYPHLHFCANPHFAATFVQKCCQYRKDNTL